MDLFDRRMRIHYHNSLTGDTARAIRAMRKIFASPSVTEEAADLAKTIQTDLIRLDILIRTNRVDID